MGSASPRRNSAKAGGKLLSTGDMARLSGNTLRTVRFYEEAGLLRPQQRTNGGHRLFSRTELDRLVLVSELRAAGLSLESIRKMLDVKRRSATGGQAAAEVLERLDSQIAVMSARLDLLGNLRRELTRARDHLRSCVGCQDRTRYPDDCGDCKVMAKARSMTNAVSVLWNIDRTGRADD